MCNARSENWISCNPVDISRKKEDVSVDNLRWIIIHFAFVTNTKCFHIPAKYYIFSCMQSIYFTEGPTPCRYEWYSKRPDMASHKTRWYTARETDMCICILSSYITKIIISTDTSQLGAGRGRTFSMCVATQNAPRVSSTFEITESFSKRVPPNQRRHNKGDKSRPRCCPSLVHYDGISEPNEDYFDTCHCLTKPRNIEWFLPLSTHETSSENCMLVIAIVIT